MDRDHAIRIAVRGLTGEKRKAAILYLAQHPEAIPDVLGQRLHKPANRCRIFRSKQAKRRGRQKAVLVRMTAEQHRKLLLDAKQAKMTVVAFIRIQLFGKKR